MIEASACFTSSTPISLAHFSETAFVAAVNAARSSGVGRKISTPASLYSLPSDAIYDFVIARDSSL